MTSIRVGVLGANGRMGETVCQAITKSADCELVAALDLADDLSELVSKKAQVCLLYTSDAADD
jgi:4-hydroxy-tetrahydrodipicolinate reductase